MTSSQHECLVTASHCTLIDSSHGIPPVLLVVMSEVIMETIMITGCQHICCFDVDRVVMTGSHHGNNSDDWQSAQVLLQRGEL